MTKPLMCVAVGIAVAMTAATTAEAKPRKPNKAASHFTYAYNPDYVEYQSARSHQTTKRSSKHSSRRVGTRARATVDRNCLVPAARALLNKIEARFGRVEVVSTCRAGAVIAGTRRPSLHRYGMAIDFKTPHKAAVVRWLAENNPGGTMTYARSNHIHADVGSYHFVSLAGQRSRKFAAARPTPQPAAQDVSAQQVSATEPGRRTDVKRTVSRASRLAGVYAMREPNAIRQDYHIASPSTEFSEPRSRRRYVARRERHHRYSSL